MHRLSVLFLLLCSFVLTGCSGPPEEKKDVTKGATPVVDKSISAESNIRITSSGISHHFLFWRRKYQKSEKRLPPPSRAARSNSLFGASSTMSPSPVFHFHD